MAFQLIQAAQAGDQAAFLQLLKQHDRQLMAVVYRFAGSYADREDLYQDIFLHVFQSLKKFAFQADFKTWLYRVALNRCCSFHRRRPKTITMEPLTTAKLPDFEKRAKLKAIQSALRRLRGPQRISFHLFYIEDWAIEKIAEVLNCRPGTVKAHLQRARNKIKSAREVRTWLATPT